MTRLRRCAATARQVRLHSLAATTRQVRLRLAAASTVVFVVVGSTSSVFACPVCFGAEETSMIEGTKLGVFVMLGITLLVQGAFLGFFLYLRNRAKRIAEIELDTEWSELQRRPS